MKKKKLYYVAFFCAVGLLVFSHIFVDKASGQGITPPIESTTFEELLLHVLNYAKGVAGTIGVIFIIIGGIMYMLSGGNEQRMERAKRTITYAIAGIAIVLAAPTFLNEILAIVGGKISGAGGLTLQQIALNVLRLLLSIAGTLSIISMIVGAMWMLTAYGSVDRFQLGKKTVTYSIIGTIIAFGSLIIAQQIAVIVGS